LNRPSNKMKGMGDKMKGWLLRNPEKLEDRSIQKLLKLIEENGAEIEVVDPTKIHVFCDVDFDGKIYVGEEVKEVPDYVIAAFFTEKNYHTASVLKMLESVGVLCVNTYDCIKNVDDKLLSIQKIVESTQNVRFPKSLLLTSETTAAFVSVHFKFPVVVKVMHGSKGKGVVLIHSEKELSNLISINTSSDFGDEIIIQECIASSRGRDLRTMICNGKYSASFIRENPESFVSNVAKGGSLTQFDPPEAVKKVAEEIAQVLGVNMGSVDFLFGENDTFYFCEANAMPGLALAFDPKKDFLELLQQVKNRPEPAWKKRVTKGEQ